MQISQQNQLPDQIRVSQLQDNEQPLPQMIGKYKLGKTLGKGTFGKVKQAIHSLTNQKVAIKIIDKNTIQDEDDKQRILREVQIMKTCRHPNIIQLYEIIQTDTKIFLVLEYSQQGELFKLMTTQGRLKERAAGRIFLQIINAVQYLHRLDIVHRDLKPENILLDTDFNIKLIDYGLSNYHQEGKKLSTACGSPCYAPPEMLSGNDYNGKIGDVWSLGIIFYGMICGTLPFQQQNTKQLYKRVIQGYYYIPNDITIESIQVIKKMLVTDPQKRITIGQIRKLRFFKEINKIQPQIIGIIVGFHPMPIDNQILDKMINIVQKDKNQIQYMIKQNQHNQYTTAYYLIQKQVLREGSKTIVDLQIFLETHQKYQTQYGKQTLKQYFKEINKSIDNSGNNNMNNNNILTNNNNKLKENRIKQNNLIVTPRKSEYSNNQRKSELITQRKKIDKNKIQRKGLSKQKYNKNQLKQQLPLKFFSNQKINKKFLSSLDSKNMRKALSKTKYDQNLNPTTKFDNNNTKQQKPIRTFSISKTRHLNNTQHLNTLHTIQSARGNHTQRIETIESITTTDRKSKSRSNNSKFKKLKYKSPTKNLAINLWNAYFQDPLEKKVFKEKRKKINPKQQMKIQNFDMNVKNLKEGFMQLQFPNMEKTKKINIKKEQTVSLGLDTTKRINFHPMKQK